MNNTDLSFKRVMVDFLNYFITDGQKINHYIRNNDLEVKFEEKEESLISEDQQSKIKYVINKISDTDHSNEIINKLRLKLTNSNDLKNITTKIVLFKFDNYENDVFQNKIISEYLEFISYFNKNFIDIVDRIFCRQETWEYIIENLGLYKDRSYMILDNLNQKISRNILIVKPFNIFYLDKSDIYKFIKIKDDCFSYKLKDYYDVCE